MIKCSKCNFENEDDAKFCASCGKPLDEEIATEEKNNQEYECPKCGRHFVGQQKWCSGCGIEFNWPEGGLDNVPIKVQGHKKADKPASKQNLEKATKENQSESKKFNLFDVIAYAITLGAILFALIGVWLDSVSVPNLGTTQSLGVSFWFNEFWDMPKSASYPYVGDFILFLIAVICILGFGTVVVVKSIKGLVQKKQYNCQIYALFAVVPVLVYFAAFRSLLNESITSYGTTISTKMGGGYILSLLSIIFLMIAVLGYKIAGNINNKTISVGKTILELCVAVCTLLAVVILPLAGAKVKSAGSTGTLLMCSVVYIRPDSFSEACEIYSGITIAAFYCAVVLAGFALTQIALPDSSKNNNIRMTMVSTAFAIIVGLIVSSCLLIGELDPKGDTSIGFAPILSLIFVAGALSCLIAKDVLDKKASN